MAAAVERLEPWDSVTYQAIMGVRAQQHQPPDHIKPKAMEAAIDLSHAITNQADLGGTTSFSSLRTPQSDGSCC